MHDFLLKTQIWAGDFNNYVNQEQGIVQKGRIQLKIESSGPNTASQWIQFIRPDGTRTGYQGEAKIQIQGRKIINPEPPAKDVNTDTKLEDYRFEGYVGEGHIHILEQFVELQPDEKRESRRNELHYRLLDDDRVMMISSVYVGGELLVFANSILSRESDSD